ncbi:lysophospholipid acyltransferase family protein [Polaribacter sp. HL-MS24]|uniref:lysophospholipid acyltransferase family protein n=1 Tax=Polaribacter sp. HL-MS24 TaxID=3077735 RepID=UPI002935022D|nr:lysophospholipid acyltransferase family protein [Polaribacter sp. HL-MS24]WOC41038.1 lysophospholipid acyltransferase family protein [Polaribacter sp. HL-MS24]
MKLISYILSPIFILVFFLLLVIFQCLQWLSMNIFGPKAHKVVVDVLNWFSIKSLLILGIPVYFENDYTLPENTTLIFTANHQSLFDIPPLILFFRKYHPKFVSKIELGKGIPSISYNLRHGGAALIDRKDPKQALTALAEFSKRIHKNNWSAVIFPEGTRSKTGKPKKFSTNGIKMIAKYNKEAYIVPVTINNSWKVFKYGKFPLGIGSPITIKTHEPIKIDSLPFDELMAKVETTIISHIK